jgi:hypothetical protein
MRRGGRAVLACLSALIVLAGCSRTPAGVDGDLTDDWAAFANAVTATPIAGACYKVEYSASWTGDFGSKETGCTQDHWTETAYVGTFSGDVASRDVPPLTGSAELATAFKECATKTNDFLGGDWQTSNAWLGIVEPSKQAWTGGARWFRCDLTQFDSTFTDVEAKASAKDGLRGSRPLARTCEVVGDDSSGAITDEAAVDCAQPHNAEFAGLYTLTGSTYPSSQSARDSAEGAACGRVMQSYLGLSSTRSHYFGWLYYDVTEEQWNLGIRTGLCFVIGFASNGRVNTVRFTGSIKGGGDKKPAGWHT